MTQALAGIGILTRDQLAAEIGVKPDTLYAWERQGMPFLKRGDIILYDVKAVVKWIKETPIKQRGRKRMV